MAGVAASYWRRRLAVCERCPMAAIAGSGRLRRCCCKPLIGGRCRCRPGRRRRCWCRPLSCCCSFWVARGRREQKLALPAPALSLPDFERWRIRAKAGVAGAGVVAAFFVVVAGAGNGWRGRRRRCRRQFLSSGRRRRGSVWVSAQFIPKWRPIWQPFFFGFLFGDFVDLLPNRRLWVVLAGPASAGGAVGAGGSPQRRRRALAS